MLVGTSQGFRIAAADMWWSIWGCSHVQLDSRCKVKLESHTFPIHDQYLYIKYSFLSRDNQIQSAIFLLLFLNTKEMPRQQLASHVFHTHSNYSGNGFQESVYKLMCILFLPSGCWTNCSFLGRCSKVNKISEGKRICKRPTQICSWNIPLVFP